MWFQLGFCSGSHFVSPAPQLCSSWHFPSLISGSLPISLASLLHLSLLILIPPPSLSFFLSMCMRSSCLVRGLRLGVDGRPAAVIQHWVHCLGVGRRGGGGSAGLYLFLSLCHTHTHTKRRWSHHVEPCSLNTQTSSSFVSPPSFPLPCWSVWRKSTHSEARILTLRSHVVLKGPC